MLLLLIVAQFPAIARLKSIPRLRPGHTMMIKSMPGKRRLKPQQPLLSRPSATGPALEDGLDRGNRILSARSTQGLQFLTALASPLGHPLKGAWDGGQQRLRALGHVLIKGNRLVLQSDGLL